MTSFIKVALYVVSIHKNRKHKMEEKKEGRIEKRRKG